MTNYQWWRVDTNVWTWIAWTTTLNDLALLPSPPKNCSQITWNFFKVGTLKNAQLYCDGPWLYDYWGAEVSCMVSRLVTVRRVNSLLCSCSLLHWTLSALICGIVVWVWYWAETWSGSRDMLYGSGSHFGSLSPFTFVYRSPDIVSCRDIEIL